MTTEAPAPFREPFDPRCTEWTTFAELEVTDFIDYWGEARPVILHHDFDGRVRLLVQGPYGQDLALALGTEGVYRMPRNQRNEAIVRGIYRNTAAAVRRLAPGDANAMADKEEEVVPLITAAIESHPHGARLLRELLTGRTSPEKVREQLLQMQPVGPWFPSSVPQEAPSDRDTP